MLPEWSRACGRTLGDLSLGRNHGVQVAGVHRDSQRILIPGAHEALWAGDEILVLGPPVQIADFRDWLYERAGEGGVPTAS